ncbi:amino acid transmembrane transporter [Rhodotorula toruloides]|uniref:Amino acid transmembrane transporter n=1 Tax=Rhodotorula toruloides TaxID=5286 RepID=A0A511K997_RHOTO|nr:amino acid transmembrane transporter [Rhodotorula toruloides]
MATSRDQLADVELGDIKGGSTTLNRTNSLSKHDGNGVVLRGLDGDSPDGSVHRNLKARHLQAGPYRL